MSEIIDVSASTIQDDRSGWQAEDQIAVEYLEACKEAVASDAVSYTHLTLPTKRIV